MSAKTKASRFDIPLPVILGLLVFGVMTVAARDHVRSFPLTGQVSLPQLPHLKLNSDEVAYCALRPAACGLSNQPLSAVSPVCTDSDALNRGWLGVVKVGDAWLQDTCLMPAPGDTTKSKFVPVESCTGFDCQIMEYFCGGINISIQAAAFNQGGIYVGSQASPCAKCEKGACVQLPPRAVDCGNGIVEEGEECDSGWKAGFDAFHGECSGSCKLLPTCKETDGGLDFYGFGGTTATRGSSGADACAPSAGKGGLFEKFCFQGRGVSVVVQCPHGCSEGACVSLNGASPQPNSNSDCTDPDGFDPAVKGVASFPDFSGYKIEDTCGSWPTSTQPFKASASCGGAGCAHMEGVCAGGRPSWVMGYCQGGCTAGVCTGWVPTISQTGLSACGNYRIDEGEECDVGFANGSSYCSATCGKKSCAEGGACPPTVTSPPKPPPPEVPDACVGSVYKDSDGYDLKKRGIITQRSDGKKVAQDNCYIGTKAVKSCKGATCLVGDYHCVPKGKKVSVIRGKAPCSSCLLGVCADSSTTGAASSAGAKSSASVTSSGPAVACTPRPPSTAQCTKGPDSDGDNPFTQGYYVSNGIVVSETCAERLVDCRNGYAQGVEYCKGPRCYVGEVTCGNGGASKEHPCAFGCRNGACLQAAENPGGSPRCGNGFIEGAEECDDGPTNGHPFRTCSVDCRREFQATTCTESDGGKNFYKKGYMWGGDGIGGDDYCLNYGNDRNVLVETFCDGSTGKSMRFQCPYGCKHGACLNSPGAEPVAPFDYDCKETDGGAVPGVRGTLTIKLDPVAENAGVGQDEDQCYQRIVGQPTGTHSLSPVASCSGATCYLEEVSCNGHDMALRIDSVMYGSALIPCPQGCTNGACAPGANVPATCTDSENGVNFYNPGSVKGGSGPIKEAHDICTSHLNHVGHIETMIDYYCENNQIKWTSYQCPSPEYGCRNEVCIRVPD